ncbi:MAG: bifunctional diaminohydroxyphosphoribosylaminopyrimidine deaminase/5-amino-6-(5-phosphoribosylamino)uracil reductase RibD, partial [Candidatus ainarchaeum sp.]|nr:bifunctional diaminohydroxyphosphoribosylaminopyrimidine deaminase/5-amino-6-(5-phosphoribosylamino)uracil reductase RibD [Candidatus ainarchaeum sp.]
MNNQDKYFMSIALELAKKGFPSPNPYVGAVIVKNNKIIGKGFHKRAGLPHAEIEAINSVKNKSLIKGSILYVTLEPCSHYGKTPPCTAAIIKYSISKVIFGVKDPTTKVKGEEVLRKNKIITASSLLSKESENLNEVFFHYTKKHLPFIALKVASSSDGFISKKCQKTNITGKAAKLFSHKLRSKYDA